MKYEMATEKKKEEREEEETGGVEHGDGVDW